MRLIKKQAVRTLAPVKAELVRTPATLPMPVGSLIPFITDLDAPVLQLNEVDFVTLRQLFQGGVHAFGICGSGKSSALGRMAYGIVFRSGGGALFTCVKFSDIDMLKRAAEEHGRADSLIVFDENEGFNFLEYEIGRQGMDGVGTVSECLMRIIEAARRATGGSSSGGGESSEFFDNSMRQALRYAIPAIYAATGTLTIGSIIQFIVSAPRNRSEPNDRNWQNTSFMYSIMHRAMMKPVVPMPRDMAVKCDRFWREGYVAAPEKTIANVVATVSATLDRFQHGRLNKAFCGRTTVVPEMSFLGACIVLACPVLTWNEDGIIAQHLFKFFWERAVLNRNFLPQKYRDRPLYLFCDESQETVNSYDSDFLSVARDSKCCVIFMTQTLPNYFSKLGGAHPREDAEALVGKFSNLVFFANSCPTTNDFAARTCGRVMKRHRNFSEGMSRNNTLGFSHGYNESSGSSVSSSYSASSGSGGASESSSRSRGFNESSGMNWGSNTSESLGRSESKGYSESLEYLIEPGQFARDLKMGGPQNDYEVTGYWFQTGRKFNASGTNVCLARFSQL